MGFTHLIKTLDHKAKSKSHHICIRSSQNSKNPSETDQAKGVDKDLINAERGKKVSDKVLNEAKKGNISVIKIQTTSMTIHASDNRNIYKAETTGNARRVQKYISIEEF